MPLNEFDDIIATGKVSNDPFDIYSSLDEEENSSLQEPTDPIFNALDQAEQEERKRMQLVQYNTKEKDPDQYAKVLQLSKDTGIPAPIAERKFDHLHKKYTVEKVDYDRILKTSPNLAKFIQTPENAVVTKDDMENLEFIERSLAASKEGKFDTLKSYPKSAAIGIYDMHKFYQVAKLVTKASFGSGNLSELRDELGAITYYHGKAQKWRESMPVHVKLFDEALAKSSGDLEESFSRITHSAPNKLWRGEVLSGLAEYASGGGATVADILALASQVPRNPLASINKAVEMAPYSVPILVASYAGGGAAATLLGAEQLALKTAIGQGLGAFLATIPIEAAASMTEDLQNRGIDFSNQESLLKAFSDANMIDEVAGRGLRKGFGVAAIQGLSQGLAGRFLSSAKGKGFLAKTGALGKEAAQQGVGEFTEEIVGQTLREKGDIGKISLADAVQEGMFAWMQEAGGIAVGAAGRGVGLRSDFHADPAIGIREVSEKANDSLETVNDAYRLEQASEAIKSGKLLDRSEDKMKGYLDAQDPGDIYFQIDDFKNYWDEQGVPAVRIAEEILGDTKLYREAEVTGIIKIPRSTYLTKLSKTAHIQGLMPFMITKQGGPKVSEAIAFNKALPETVGAIADEVSAQTQPIRDDVRQKFLDVGVSTEEAGKIALLAENVFRSIGESENLDPNEIYKEFAPAIVKEGVNLSPERVRQIVAMAKERKSGGIQFQSAQTPTFFSQIQRTIDEKIQGKSATVEQVRAIIKTLKPEEVKWSGIEDFLKGKTKVDKAELLKFLDFNQLEVEDVIKGAALTKQEAYDEVITGGEVFLPGLQNPLTREQILESQPDAQFQIGGSNIQTKFGQYQLPGGENYRELLLRIPMSFVTGQTPFTGGHFEETNVLAHVRFNDRTDAQGNKVLFIEEIQSDWHQKGRKQGYKGDTANVQATTFHVEQAEDGGYNVVDENGQGWAYVSDRLIAEQRAREFTERGGVPSGQVKPGVPDAPFRKTWHEFALKRMIRYAAENGYDKIAWTTGEQQAERYDLSKQLSEVSYSGTNLKAFDHDGNEVISRTGITPEELPDYIGKDAAEKLMEQDPKGTLRTISGLDLKVGGEGMKGFYDQMIPKAAEKIAKKFDKSVEVKDISIKTGEGKFASQHMAISHDGESAYWVSDKSGKQISPNFGSYIEADDWRKNAQKGGSTVHSIEITPAIKEVALTQGFPLFQDRDAEIPLGFYDPKSKEVAALKDANLSTYLHEMSHYFMDLMQTFATAEGASERLKNDYNTLLKALGIESSDQLTGKHQEQLVDWMTDYFMEGKAPSPELRTAFDTFKRWLGKIYNFLRQSEIPLSPEVRGVFDRLLATEEEILRADYEYRMRENIPTAEQLGLTGKAAIAYDKKVEDSFQVGKEKLSKKLLKDFKRRPWRYLKTDEVKALKEEIEKEYDQKKEYIAASIIKTGKNIDGSEAFDVKLNRAAVAEEFGETVATALPKSMFAKDGVVPDMAAPGLGYLTGKELVDGLLLTTKRSQAINAEIDIRLNRKYGDLLKSEQLPQETLSALHNEKSGEILREQLRHFAENNPSQVKEGLQGAAQALNALEAEFAIAVDEYESLIQSEQDKTSQAYQEKEQALSQVKTAAQQKINELRTTITDTKQLVRRVSKRVGAYDQTMAAKVEQMISETKYSELKPNRFAIEERKFQRKAMTAALALDYDAAFTYKELELFNHELFKSAVAAKEKAESDAAYLNKFNKDKVRAKIGLAGHDYLDQIDQLLEQHDLRQSVTLTEVKNRKKLLAFVKEMEEANLPIDIPDEVLADARKVSFKDMTVEEISNLKDSVKNIETLAKLKNELIKNKKYRDFEEAIAEAVKSIQDNSRGKRKVGREDKEGMVVGVLAAHRKMASIVRQLDGWKDGGVMWELLSRGTNDVGTTEASMNEKATKELSKIFSRYGEIEQVKLQYKKELIPELNERLTRMARIVIALNYGNVEGRQRLETEGFSQDQIQAVLDSLSEKDYEFIKDIWKFLDTFWPESKALSQRTSGLSPEKVEALPYMTKYGEMPGGYYRLKYRDERGYTHEAQDLAKQTMQGAAFRATTKHGSRKARVKELNRKVRLDLGVLFEHVSEVIHDQTHYEWLIDTNKILGDDRIQNAIIENYGNQAYRQLKNVVRDIAAGDAPPVDAVDKAFSYLRNGVTISILGWKLGTALLQPLGLTQSMARIGVLPVAKGVGRFLGDAVRMENTAKFIYEKSKFMQLRAKTMLREINDIRNKLTIRGKLSAIEDSYFYFITKMQQIVDIPTWLGAYEKSLADSGVPNSSEQEQEFEEKAIAVADQAVLDSQGGGQTKDLASVQRGHPIKKLFTNFYSFGSTTFQLLYESVAKTNIKNPASVGRFLVDFMLLTTIPAVLSLALRNALKGKFDDEDYALEKLAKEQINYLMGTMVGVRELGGVVSGFKGYEGPAGTRFFSEVTNLYTQAEQGESDRAFWKAAANTTGILFHTPIPSQINRTVNGAMALLEDKTNNPLVLLTGPPYQPKRRSRGGSRKVRRRNR